MIKHSMRKSLNSGQLERCLILKINNSWPELFDFQNSFKCH